MALPSRGYGQTCQKYDPVDNATLTTDPTSPVTNQPIHRNGYLAGYRTITFTGPKVTVYVQAKPIPGGPYGQFLPHEENAYGRVARDSYISFVLATPGSYHPRPTGMYVKGYVPWAGWDNMWSSSTDFDCWMHHETHTIGDDIPQPDNHCTPATGPVTAGVGPGTCLSPTSVPEEASLRNNFENGRISATAHAWEGPTSLVDVFSQGYTEVISDRWHLIWDHEYYSY